MNTEVHDVQMKDKNGSAGNIRQPLVFKCNNTLCKQ